MFDSRSDAPHKGMHHLRSDRKAWNGDAGNYTVVTKPEVEAKDAIAEGLADWEHEILERDAELQPVVDCESFDVYGWLEDHSLSAAPPKRGTYTSESTKRSARGPKEAKMHSTAHLIPSDPRDVGRIHKPRVAKRPFSRLSDGIKHPVTTTTVRERQLQQAADTLTTVLVAAIEADQPASNRQPAHN